MTRDRPSVFFFFFNDTATTEIYTLSLHDALPICIRREHRAAAPAVEPDDAGRITEAQVEVEALVDVCERNARQRYARSEEHTSELQSQSNLVCRLLLEKKKNTEHEANLSLRETAV